MKKWVLCIAVFGALIPLIFPRNLPLAHAQEVPQQQRGQQGNNITDQELGAFAKAYVEIQEIRLKYEPRLKEVQDPKEIERIQRETDSKAEEAVEQQGLSVESYSRIFAAANGDGELRQRILRLIEKERTRS